MNPVSETKTERKIGLAPFYNAIFAARGFALAPHHYPLVMGLEDERINNLLYIAPPGTGKSTLLDIAYPLWELGHDPTLTILSVSAGEALPQGFMAAVMQMIQHDKVFHDLFPEVRPDPSQGWAVTRGLYVKGHHASDSDASYKAVGLASKALTGLHARIHIYDDLHDRENAASPESRQVVKDTYYDTLTGRADPRGARRVAAGRWWAPDDIYQEWIQSGDWVVMELPAVRDGQTRLWYDVYVPKGMTCVYTEALTPEPIQDQSSHYVKYRAYYGAIDPTGQGFYWPASPSKRQEYVTVNRRQPRIAAINYRGDMSGGGKGIFDAEDFREYFPPEGLEHGIGAPDVQAWISTMKGVVEQAVDTALGQPQSKSLTAGIAGLLVPCDKWHRGEDEGVFGKCDHHYDVWLLDLMLGDLDFRDLVKEMRAFHTKWAARRVTIEEKQSGVGLIQVLKGSTVPVRGQQVPQGKMERAVNPIMLKGARAGSGKPVGGGGASVQGWSKMGRILYPLGAKWIETGPDGTPATAFLNKVCAFTGGTDSADEFDALVHLVTRAITLSLGTVRFGDISALQGPTDEDVMIANSDDPRRLVLNAFAEAPMFARTSDNPLHGMCIAPCGHYGVVDNKTWCGLHGTPVNTLGGCAQWTDPARMPKQELV